MRTRHLQPSSARRVFAGLAAGALGGLAGAWAMGRFQAMARRAERRLSADSGGGDSDGLEPATQVAGFEPAHSVADRELEERDEEKPGTAVHYGFGSAVGAAYGAVSEIVPALSALGGLPFGAGLWLTADEVLVPAGGPAPPPTGTPARAHGSAFGAHLVYALTAETVRRALRGSPR